MNWIQKSLEAAKTPNESNQNPKPNYQARGDPCVGKSPQFDHEDVKHSTRTGRPVCGSESTKSCVLMCAKFEEDQTRMGRPVKVEEHDIDFRVPGLSHAVVKEAEDLRVQELF